VIARLLDQSISTIAKDKGKIAAALREEAVAANTTAIRAGPLDPLLKKLVTYTSLEDLEYKILEIWELIDLDGDESLNNKEMNDGTRALDFEPPMYIPMDNWQLLTEGLLDQDGGFFSFMVTRELHSYMERKLVLAIQNSQSDEGSMGTLCGLKLLVSPLLYHAAPHAQTNPRTQLRRPSFAPSDADPALHAVARTMHSHAYSHRRRPSVASTGSLKGGAGGGEPPLLSKGSGVEGGGARGAGAA